MSGTGEVSYRELYKVSAEQARNEMAVECKRQLLEHEKMLAAAHERISNLARENSEMKSVIGKLESRLQNMADWAKKKDESEKKIKEKV